MRKTALDVGCASRQASGPTIEEQAHERKINDSNHCTRKGCEGGKSLLATASRVTLRGNDETNTDRFYEQITATTGDDSFSGYPI